MHPAAQSSQSPPQNFKYQQALPSQGFLSAAQLQQAPSSYSAAQRVALYKQVTEQHSYLIGQLDQKQYTGNRIKNVWVYNFEEELDKISHLIEEYPCIAFVSPFNTINPLIMLSVM